MTRVPEGRQEQDTNPFLDLRALPKAFRLRETLEVGTREEGNIFQKRLDIEKIGFFFLLALSLSLLL